MLPDMKAIREAAAAARYTANPSGEELQQDAQAVQKSLSDRLADLLKARKPIPGQMGFLGTADVPKKAPKAKPSGPFIGPRGGKWADAKHTIPWKEGGEAKPAFLPPREVQKRVAADKRQIGAHSQKMEHHADEMTRLKKLIKETTIGEHPAYVAAMKAHEQAAYAHDNARSALKAGRHGPGYGPSSVEATADVAEVGSRQADATTKAAESAFKPPRELSGWWNELLRAQATGTLVPTFRAMMENGHFKAVTQAFDRVEPYRNRRGQGGHIVWSRLFATDAELKDIHKMFAKAVKETKKRLTPEDHAKALYDHHAAHWGAMSKREKAKFKAKMTRLAQKVDPQKDTKAQAYLDVLTLRTGHEPKKKAEQLELGAGKKELSPAEQRRQASAKHYEENAEWYSEQTQKYRALARTPGPVGGAKASKARSSAEHVAEAFDAAASASRSAAAEHRHGSDLAATGAGSIAEDKVAAAFYWEDAHHFEHSKDDEDPKKHRERAKNMRKYELEGHKEDHHKLPRGVAPLDRQRSARHLEQAEKHHSAASATRSKLEHRRHHEAYTAHLHAAASSRNMGKLVASGRQPSRSQVREHQRQEERAWAATQKIQVRAAKRAAAKSAKKSLSDRIADLLQKAKLSGAFKPGKPKIPEGMRFGGGGGGAPVQGHVAKPPAGFTPIPHSKRGGYHKPLGGGKYVYWYPGQGIVGQKHEADASATTHQEATAKHVMEQIQALEQKGKVTAQDLAHTKQAIKNAWPGGPKDAPEHIAGHYRKLLQMAEGEGGAEEKIPDVGVKDPAAKPTREAKAAARAKETVKQIKKKDRETERKAKVEAARKTVITDPKKVPPDFNKLPKMERAKMTANWTVVKDRLDSEFPRADYAAHPDMRQAISEHIDEMVESGIIVPANAIRAKDMLVTQMTWGEAAGLSKTQLGALLEENARKLAFQEKETLMRTLGDHGIRHLSVNAKSAHQIFDELEKGGVKVSPMERLMASQVMIDHDMGYTIDVIAKGGFKIRDNYHPQASSVLVKQQRAKYSRLFGAGNMKAYTSAVETHSGSAVDWRNDKLGSATRLADNTHLFADKFPEVLFDTNEGVEVLTKIKLAAEVVPASGTEIDERGNPRSVRTPEEQKKYDALIGGIRGQLHDAVMARKDLPPQTKKLLAKAVSEIGEVTAQFTVGRLAGRQPQFRYDKRSGDMQCVIEQSNARRALGEIFGDDQTDVQFKKMLGDFGAEPADAKNPQPPPQAKIRVGDEGNGINFTWRAPTTDHPTEQRYAKVMQDTKARLAEIQAMQGPSKHAAIKRFFGADLKKAMEDLMSKWTMRDGLEDLEKSAMGSLAARTGRGASPFGSAPEVRPKGPGIKERIKTAIGKRPPGAGWSPIPGGKKGGYRKMDRGKWLYWYPGMGKEGAEQHVAERHQAQKRLAHHEKQTAKWQEKHAKRREAGSKRGAELALEQRDHHARQAEKIREEHGIMGKSVRVNRCTIHLGPDEALVKSIESGELGIGTVPRVHSSRSGLRKSVVAGEGFTERGQDIREQVARSNQDALVLRDDPAGNDGNGGLASWFSDARSTQEPTVRTPAVIVKGMDQDQINVIDDSDPYTRRMHQADPRTKSAAYDLDYAFHRDAKRTQ